MNIYTNPENSDIDCVKAPNKKVLFFSDGTLEVDEWDLNDDGPLQEKTIPESQSASSPPPLSVNPQELTWFPWMWHYTSTAGAKALEMCDYVGESLASFFGITTPKYQFEINEYLKNKKAQEKETQNEMEMKKWNNDVEFGNSFEEVIIKEPNI